MKDPLTRDAFRIFGIGAALGIIIGIVLAKVLIGV